MRTAYWCGVVAAILCLTAFATSSTTSGFVPSALADDEDDQPAPAPEPKGDEGEEGDEGADGAEGEAKPKLHKLYVPFKDLKDVFEKEGEGVFMPYDQFRKLWDRAYRVMPDKSTPPVAAAVRSAKYTGVASGEMIRFEAEVDVEVLAKGWQRVPLNFRGIGVEEATIDDEVDTVDVFGCRTAQECGGVRHIRPGQPAREANRFRVGDDEITPVVLVGGKLIQSHVNGPSSRAATQ